MCKHTDSIRAVAARATAEDVIAGCRWYPNARLVISDLADEFDHPVRTVAGVVAALSQRQRWSTNLASARQILSGANRTAGVPLAVLKARLIRDGLDPEDVLGPSAYKVRAFYRALMGDDESAVVDRWMLTALDWEREGYGPRQYRTLAGILRDEAQAHGLCTTAYQAMVWCVVRGTAD